MIVLLEEEEVSGVQKKFSGVRFSCSLQICIAMGVVLTSGVANLLYDLSNPNQYHHCDVTTVEKTSRRIRFGKTTLFIILLFFILQKCDYTLHYHRYATSITQRKSIISSHNVLYKSIYQTSTKDPLICPQTLTSNAST